MPSSEDKSPLALLPGLLLDERFWRAQVDALADVAETRVADFMHQDTAVDMARSVLEAMPPRFALAGLSMGGYVALEIMRQAPARVTRLALLDTKARPDTAEQTRRRRGLIQLARQGTFKGVTERLLPLLIHESRLSDGPLTGAIMAMAERCGRDVFLRQQHAIMTRPDSRPTLVEIRCPTLVLCGRQDALTPLDCHEEMAAGIPGADLIVLGGAGHLPPMERPRAVNAALRTWLTGG